MNPTTDDEQENDITNNTNMVNWQLVRGIKLRKPNKVFHNNNSSKPSVTTSNRYELLTNKVSKKEEPTDVNTKKRIPRPPPIFVYDVINYPQMIQHLAEVAEEENYSTRPMANNIIKINCHSAETYRKIIAFMKENIVHNSYRPKNERPYGIVIKTYCNRPHLCVKCGGQHNSQLVKRVQIPLQNVVPVEGRVPQITRAATIIIT
jgi:hypothetical protein